MASSLAIVTPPTVEPITAAEVRARLGLSSDILDATITSWIVAERQRIDGPVGGLGRALITQTWDFILDRFPVFAGDIRLPLAPVQAIVSVTYTDLGGTTQTVDASDYRLLSGEPARLIPGVGKSWPGTPANGWHLADFDGIWGASGSVVIRFRAGYGDSPSNVPEAFKQAITLRASLARSMMGQSLFVRSETVDGVGSTDYSGGTQAAATLAGEVERLLNPFRLTAGIS